MTRIGKLVEKALQRQPDANAAKPYQVRQFWEMVDRYDLKAENEHDA